MERKISASAYACLSSYEILAKMKAERLFAEGHDLSFVLAYLCASMADWLARSEYRQELDFVTVYNRLADAVLSVRPGCVEVF